jgi:hypothetical protein
VENAVIDSVNGHWREQCLNQSDLHNLIDASQTLKAWQQDYNHARPHRVLNYLNPGTLAAPGTATHQQGFGSLRQSGKYRLLWLIGLAGGVGTFYQQGQPVGQRWRIFSPG